MFTSEFQGQSALGRGVEQMSIDSRTCFEIIETLRFRPRSDIAIIKYSITLCEICLIPVQCKNAILITLKEQKLVYTHFPERINSDQNGLILKKILLV